MSISFLFIETADKSLWKDAFKVVTYFRPPLTTETWQRPGMKDKVIELAQYAAYFTRALLYVSCNELKLKHFPIKTDLTEDTGNSLMWSHYYFVVRYESSHYRRTFAPELRIACPVNNHPICSSFTSNGLPATAGWPHTEDEKGYWSHLQPLLNATREFLELETNMAEPYNGLQVDPQKYQKAANTLTKKYLKAGQAKQRQQEKEEQKRKAHEEKLALKQNAPQPTNSSTTEPVTGAGRRVGAVPGIFKGIMFRSQLEIRFATQLEAKGIRWIYEGERLSEGQYLVDFYLPDLHRWVEVKGRIEPRDDYLLKDVAAYLKRERQETVFVYTQSKAYSVSATVFKELTHKAFWELLG